MQCPIDQSELQITTRENVEIDYCPRCRGVWLDRGELDKILDRFTQDRPARTPYADQGAVRSQPYGPPPRAYRDDDDDDDDDDDRRRYRDQRGYRDDDERYRGGKRRGWLGNLFDF